MPSSLLRRYDFQQRKRSNWHKDFESIDLVFMPGMSESWPKRSFCIISKQGQCRRKCSLSSNASPCVQQGFKQSNLRLNLSSLRALNFKRILFRYSIPSRSEMLYKDFFTGFIIWSSFRLNSETDLEFFISSSSKFYSWSVFWKYVFESQTVRTMFSL